MTKAGSIKCADQVVWHIWLKNFKEENYLEDLEVDGKAILKWTS
jgi:hypothetical protein